MLMKVLVTGSGGQLGRELNKELEGRMPGCTDYVTHGQLDIADADAVRECLSSGLYTHIINCAAYTAVDRAEEEKLECTAVNADGVSNLARQASEFDCKLIHISTDYVFGGNSCRPYTEGDKPSPTTVYGSTKRKGETALLGLLPESIIIRTGWLYSSYGHNFLKTILRLADEREELRVVCDQVGTPTYARDLAGAIVDILSHPQWTPGIFNYANEGVASWYDFAVVALVLAGKADRARSVVPILTEDYPTAASRPQYSVLDKTKIKAVYNLTIPHWQDALARCLKCL